MESTKRQARLAGLLYTLDAIVAPVSLIYVPGRLASAAGPMAARLHSLEPLLRVGIFSELLYQVIEIFLVILLYDLFRDVNKRLARQMLVLGLMPVPIVFLNAGSEIGAILAAQGNDALADLLYRLHGQGLLLAGVFWGLWLFPLGLLIIRSGFIPKILGYSVMIGGAGYLLGSLSGLILPSLASEAVTDRLGTLAGWLVLGELPIIPWLLVVGTRVPKPD